MSKLCSRCRVILPLLCFGFNRSRKDGRQSYCDKCRNTVYKEGRSIRTILYPEVQREIERLINKEDYQRNPERHRLDTSLRKKLEPEKNRARSSLYYAVVTAKVHPPDSCSMCDKREKLQAHHSDYTKPLDVVWVCQPCHNLLERTEIQR